MPVWTEDDGSTTNYLDKQVDLEAGTTYRIRNSSSSDLFTIVESTGVITSLGGLTVSGDVNGASASEMAHLSGLSTNIVTALASKADKTNVLELDNTSAFTPSADYHPATKKYVLDNVSGGGYSLPEAATTTRGGIELFSDTDQSVAGESVSTTANRTYGLQLNSDGQGVINVPWANTQLDNSGVIGKVLTGLSTGSGGAVVAGDTILAAFGRLENRVALNDLKATDVNHNTDVNVAVDTLETRLGEIDTDITIGASSGIKTTIAGDLQVNGGNITNSSLVMDGTLTTAGLLTASAGIKLVNNTIYASDGGATITLDTSDNVTIAGDLTVSGNDIIFGNAGKITSSDGYMGIQDTDGTGDYFLLLNTQNADKDSSISFAENSSVKWNLGNDGDDSDSFKMSTNSAGLLETSTQLTLTSGGNLTVGGTVNGIDIATDVAANSAKNTNVSTALSIGTASVDVVNITSDGGTDDVTIPTATTGNAGVMSKVIYDQWATNTVHVNSSHAPADSLSKSLGGTMGAGINMADNAIGFTQFAPTYNSSDTEVHFDDYGNKAFATFGTGNITDLNLYFPNFSCNCVLLLKQDAAGSRTVTNWKTFDQADTNESTVQFAGGSSPTLTTAANKIDILSFYWDNDNHKAYGTITKNF